MAFNASDLDFDFIRALYASDDEKVDEKLSQLANRCVAIHKRRNILISNIYEAISTRPDLSDKITAYIETKVARVWKGTKESALAQVALTHLLIFWDTRNLSKYDHVILKMLGAIDPAKAPIVFAKGSPCWYLLRDIAACERREALDLRRFEEATWFCHHMDMARKDVALIDVCREGDGDLVGMLLRDGADPFYDTEGSPYHCNTIHHGTSAMLETLKRRDLVHRQYCTPERWPQLCELVQ